MLNDEQKRKLAASMHEEVCCPLDPQGCDEPTGREVLYAEAIALLIDRWLTEALTSGALPEGWERREAWGDERLGVITPQPVNEEARLHRKRRTVITGPWEEVSGDADA